MVGDPQGQSRFTVELRGYDREAVDALLARIERTLAGDAGVEAVTPDDVRHATFSVVWRGYSEEEVDAFLERAVVELSGAPGSHRGTEGPSGREDGVSPGASTARFRPPSELIAVESRPRGERFPRTRFPREGYDVGEVDAFVERIRTALTTRPSAAEIRNARFTPTRLRSGYAIEEVDRWLDAVEAYASGSG